MTHEEEMKTCLDEWFEKTDWIQKTAKASELGMHRADIMKKRIELLTEELKKESNRAARAEQELEQMTSRWKTANWLNIDARHELAKIKLENNL